ncbi:Putative Ataxia telangiectasia mutated [[Torrubiella] hemipterigena]|nr:Putative Ataxia telangiectasia mutated [[Torrubiella] hemipterigena]
MASGDTLSTEPIESLLLVLKNPVQIAEFSKFDSSTFHSFFENLFRFVLASKRDFLSKPKSKTPLTRLAKAGELVKISIGIGIPRIRQKTLSAVVDHITQVIAGPNGTQIEPIVDNYGKALSDLVAFPSHVEHLATSEKARWHACVDFFISIVHRAMPNDACELDSMRQDSPRLGTPAARSMTVRASSVLYSARGADVARKGQLDDALDALQNLSIGSNAPILDRLDELTEVGLRVLSSGNGSLHSKIASFAIINNLLTVSKCEKEEETRTLTQSLVPIIAYWWRSDKSDRDSALAGLRQEILRTVMLIGPPLEYIVSKMVDKDTADELDQLLDGLWLEYSRRETKLQLEDITFSRSELMNGYLQHKFFGLQTHSAEAEQRWMLVKSIAALENILSSYSLKTQEHARSDPDARRKKRRTELHESRILKRFNAGDKNIQFAALHVLPFILNCQDLLQDDLNELLPLLLELTNHKDSLVVSWSLIALACCALSYHTRTEARHWKQSWLIATRTVSISGTSRAACFLLHAIADRNIFPHHEIAEDVNGIVAAADVKGPAVLCDTSIALMSKFMLLRNMKLPNASHATSNHIIRWLFLRWKPAEISRGPPASSLDIINLLCNCCGSQRFIPDEQALVPGGSLFALYTSLKSTAKFESYLLLLEDPVRVTTGSKTIQQDPDRTTTSSITDRTSSYATKKLILELLYPKLEEFGGICTEWTVSAGKGNLSIPLEIFDNFLSALLVGALMLPHVLDINSSQATSLESVIHDLADRGITVAISSSESETFIHHLLTHVAPFMPRMNSLSIETLQAVHHGLYKLLMKLSFCMEGGKISQDFSDIQDQMDLDDEFQSQSSRTTTVSTPNTSPRTLVQAQTSYVCFYSDIQSRFGLLREFHDDESQTGLVPALFVEKLTDLSNDELLAKYAFVIELFSSDLVASVDTALLIIQRIGSILSKYAYTCCEICLVTCIDIIDGLTSIWRQDDDNLNGAVGDLYYYLVNQALPSNMLSPRALISLSSLLFTLLKVYPGYGTQLELDSCRTTLFRIMENTRIEVKYFIADRIADLFDLFILAVHDEVFVDVLDRLPSDPAQTSGIAYRLLVLTRLACKWPTLLRRCVYHIFETPGKVQNANKHAERCMNEISKQLKLDSARDLFKLFSRQLLYTWMENDSPESIPYFVFDFDDVSDLLKSAEADAVGLAYMRNQDTTQRFISEATGKSKVDSLKNNFATSLAFSMVQIASTAAGKDHGELAITKALGNKAYTEAVYVNFVDIVFAFLSLIDQDDSVEKVLAKFPDLVYASRNLKDILAISHSPSQLPPNQQPVFRAKYVIYELSRLCQGTQFQLHELWTPSLVVSVVRKLLNAVRPALGSLHACSILRKIRLVVALAGKVVFDSYCLEMLLTTTRTFVVDGECADDALGLSQYLLLGGQMHLEKHPSLLAGYSLSTLVSLRVFLESSQSSTTQESQFRATMQKAQKFHDWFTKYLANANITFNSQVQKNAFSSITQAAGYTRSSGNAEKNTHESNLLLNILGDEGSADQLLDQSSRKLALSLLCGDFSMPAQVTDDIIDQDTKAIEYSSAVFKSCEAEGLSQNYLSWAGRVLGRAFAASGDLPDDLLCETKLQQYAKLSPNKNGSEMGILSLLQELTASPDTEFAGLAEAALRSAVSIAHAVEDSPLVVACQRSLREPLYLASKWNLYHSPPSESVDASSSTIARSVWPDDINSPDWARNLSIYLVRCVSDSTLLSVLQPVLDKVPGFASKALPFIVHLVLLFQSGEQPVVRQLLSDSANTWLKTVTSDNEDGVKLLLNTVLYLRTQEFPNEATIADRLGFLSLDYGLLAQAASHCGMYKSALLFIEIAAWQSSKSSRRTSTSIPQQLDQRETLLSIFENIDDPDAYYGLPEEANLANVLARVEYENEGSKTLAFRGAQLDSHIRMNDRTAATDSQALVNALSTLGYAGLSHSLLQVQQDADPTFASIESTYKAATKLEMWNLPAISNEHHYAVNTYRAYQSISSATNELIAQNAVYDALSSSMKALTSHGHTNASTLRKQLGGLASLTELDELLNVADSANLDMIASNLDSRSQWMRRGVYDDVNQILSSRGTTLNVLAEHSDLVGSSKVPKATLRQMQVSSLLLSSQIYRFHKANQESLNISTALSNMIPACEKLDLHVDAAITIEIANSLWDHGEIGSSIRMLQSVDQKSQLNRQAIPVKRADLLAKIGHKASVARLEKPRDIQKKYLEPALKDLDGESKTQEAGLVFHQFAKFCDEQLQDADGLEDLGRLQSLKKAKSNEVQELQSLIATTKETQLRKKYNNVLGREKQWLELDQQELRRVEQTRAEFIRLSLENYLLSLAASDEHDNDALRFTALWLQRPDDEVTNKAVSRHLSKVPTRKFAGLMNQLTSRLQNDGSPFQKLLMELAYNVCNDHPYHGMYQVWSGTNAKIQQKDQVAVMRVRATELLAERLTSKESSAKVWTSISKTSRYYHAFAMDRDEKLYKAGNKLPLRNSPKGQNLMSCLSRYPIPPPTMHIEVSATRNYSHIPMVAKVDSTMTIASGISAPKIITLVGTDGKRYKQLVKGSHDDLRQDAIMEQVFAAVSSVLKLHRTTRQRNLGIRTYKVLPLTASSGLIEFVPNTIPLHEFLMPAHEKYYPRDLKGSSCRKEIFNVQGQSVEIRVSTYKKITERFHPVMKHFFMEHFTDPDEWFTRRLAYTRSTAAISILGHVLGLGDRHGHNILLDTKTGEAVHIDLGVAFEAGRILPVPELVPFRLTRDIVDGMGITKTEGVFRRCCEFTLDALREEQYSIMTILDVLRYDPLYTWTIAPLRMAKLQKNRHNDDNAAPEESIAENAKKETKTTSTLNEPSEADRALEVVRKKLSKALSVSATVNDLINQATDERNLAVLYCGWSAYA